MAQPNFPANPTPGQHYVIDNRLWVYTEYTNTSGDSEFRWVLWGNLTYVGVPGDPGVDGTIGAEGATGSTGPRGHRGPSGPTGPTGPQGPVGDSGTSLRLMGRLADFSRLWELGGSGDVNSARVDLGDMYIVENADSDYKPGDGRVKDENGIYPEDNEAWVFNPSGEDRFHIDPWLYVGPITGPEGPSGTDGVVGPTGPRGERGEQGVPGLNGAHGGAFAHMVSTPPTNGPAGKIYMVKGDWTMYVTTGK